MVLWMKKSSPRAFADRRNALSMRDFAHSLPMALLSSRELVMGQFRPMLREYGLTEQQWRVLRALIEFEKMEITELAQRSYISSPSLSRILQNLGDRGLVIRHPVRSDQRRVCISLSSSGRRLFNRIAPSSEQHYDKIEAAFGKDKLSELYSLLRELDATLSGL